MEKPQVGQMSTLCTATAVLFHCRFWHSHQTDKDISSLYLTLQSSKLSISLNIRGSSVMSRKVFKFCAPILGCSQTLKYKSIVAAELTANVYQIPHFNVNATDAKDV